jgi:hypothetical protein
MGRSSTNALTCTGWPDCTHTRQIIATWKGTTTLNDCRMPCISCHHLSMLKHSWLEVLLRIPGHTPGSESYTCFRDVSLLTMKVGQ